MGYTFNCDICEDRYERSPAFMGEFRESFLKTSPSTLTQLFRPGETITLCKDCAEILFLAGKAAVCRRCGFTTPAADLPSGIDQCPRCEHSQHFPELVPADHDNA